MLNLGLWQVSLFVWLAEEGLNKKQHQSTRFGGHAKPNLGTSQSWICVHFHTFPPAPPQGSIEPGELVNLFYLLYPQLRVDRLISQTEPL